MDSNNITTILIIEDDLGLLKQLCWHFEHYEIITANTREEAVIAAKKYHPTIILQDLGLPPDPDGVSEGMRCIEELLSLQPNCKLLVMTGRSEEENALKAVELGAYDFFHKPVNTDALDLIIDRMIRLHHLEEINRQKRTTIQPAFPNLITNDPAMLNICSLIQKIAPTKVTCTLLGESGVGKEVLARAIHSASPRSEKTFMAINCAAIPENLMESELFGYEKGAFSGAVKQTQGKIEAANNGTLFLDEIGDMPLHLQVKLLRFLQQRTIQRVGGTEEIPTDVRVVCATNKNIKQMVQSGDFREDLYYRICEMEIVIPPLRERTQDIPLLAKYFLEKIVTEYKLNIKGFTTEAMQVMTTYPWPGNIREMENKLKASAIMCSNIHLSANELILGDDYEREHKALCLQSLKETRKSAEVNAITQAIAATDNMSAAAKLLGISRPTLYDMIKKYDISTN
jgi:two-component system NtrC family response regulator